jgi:hypothetical protein
MNGQFKPVSQMPNVGNQGHLLLIILNLVLLAGVSVFIYLNTSSIDEIKVKQETVSSNVETLKKNYDELSADQQNLVEQDEYITSLFNILNSDVIKVKSDMLTMRTDIGVNKGLIDAININVDYINKIKNDFGDFNTVGLGQLLTNLKSISNELEKNDNSGNRYTLEEKMKEVLGSNENNAITLYNSIGFQYMRYKNIRNTLVETMTDQIGLILSEIQELYRVQLQSDSTKKIHDIITEDGTTTDNADDISKMKELYNKITLLKIQLNVYGGLFLYIIEDLIEIQEYCQNIINQYSGKINDQYISPFSNLITDITTMKGEYDENLTFSFDDILEERDESELVAKITKLADEDEGLNNYYKGLQFTETLTINVDGVLLKLFKKL